MHQKRADAENNMKWIGGVMPATEGRFVTSARHGFVEELLTNIGNEMVKQQRTLKRHESDTMSKIEKMTILTPAMRGLALPHGLAKFLEEFCPCVPSATPVAIPADPEIDLHKLPGVSPL